jgi:hypothetical protein
MPMKSLLLRLSLERDEEEARAAQEALAEIERADQ